MCFGSHYKKLTLNGGVGDFGALLFRGKGTLHYKKLTLHI